MKTPASIVYANGNGVETEVEFYPLTHEKRMDIEAHRLREALVDIRELVDGYVDIDRNGQPNLAMKIMTVVAIALREDQ